MQLQQILLALGVGTLYVGHAGVTGVLIRRARHSQRRVTDIALASGHGFLLFLPASIAVVGLAELSLMVRATVLIIGLGVAVTGLIQPAWTSEMLWRRTFGLRYFALAMALVALWGFASGSLWTSLAPTLLGAAASLACILSLSVSLPDGTPSLR